MDKTMQDVLQAYGYNICDDVSVYEHKNGTWVYVVGDTWRYFGVGTAQATNVGAVSLEKYLSRC